ncbi:MAG TPA: glucose-6-phosphate dehydrogenase [Planctomycetota bacterium]|jgi:glucose-6-phosphate 1-dehydrogenase
MNHVPDPCIFVLFGATGDLTRRKLMPALYNLHRDKLLPERFAVCAYARKPKTDEAIRQEMREHVTQYSRRAPDADWDALASRIFYVQGEFNDDQGYVRLKERLEQLDKELGTGGNRVFYFAVDSEFFVEITGRLAKNGLLVHSRIRHQPQTRDDHPRGWTRVVLEKPIGHNLHSARELLSNIAQHAAEDQVYRIDHYLGKETVQNILALRFGNCIFEPLWNRGYVDHVQITVAEDGGVGSRAPYYESAGALRDVVQNHMLQLLCLVAMESPGTMRADDIRNEKVKVLRNLRPMSIPQVAQNTVRGQYGPSAGGKLPGYRQERDVDPQSNTETFVALRCYVDTWRFAGVPFLLRTGKRLPRRTTQISIHFRVPPLQLFEDAPMLATCVGNVLRIDIQPEEGVSMDLAAKIPGAGMRLQTVSMDFDYARAFKRQTPEAYERLLLDAMSGDATLFTRDDEVIAQWEFISPILDAWAALPTPRFPNYPAETWGPDDALRLVPPCAQGWHLR